MGELHARATGRPPRLVRGYLGHRHAILFYSMLLTLGAAPLLAALHFDAGLLQFFLALNLVAAVLGVGERRSSLFLLLLGAALVARLAAISLHSDALALASLAFWTTIGLLAAAGEVRFAMREKAVSAEHLYAALNAYLLAGIFFGVLHLVIEQAWPGSFVGTGAARGQFSPASAIYFSFVTQATLGYGDIVPSSEVARGLAIIQAVAGQLYLAVMVARLVSLYVRKGDGS